MKMTIIRKATDKKVGTVRTVEELELTLTVLPAGVYGVNNAEGDEIAVATVCKGKVTFEGDADSPVVPNNPQATVIGETTIMTIDTFTRAYIECALWSSCDENDVPLDSSYGIEDMAPETLAGCIEDCAQFQANNRADFAACGLSDESAGHDFWLTRNGHGAGYWDRGLGAIGAILTDAAHVYGSVDLYVGDDGMIYS